MRAYSASSLETVRALDLLKDWAGEGLLTAEQYKSMQQETVCDLRRTNIFLRLVLGLFTLIIAGAGVALFFLVILSNRADRTTGVLLMIFAAVCYAAAELAVSRARLYRYGIEEALAACSVGFLCAGMLAALFGGQLFSTSRAVCLVPAVGAVASLWIWHRFGLFYAFLAAMIFVVWVPGYWTSSHEAQHVIVAAFYAAGLAAVIIMRPRYRFMYLDSAYSIAEALLWLGVYLAINLQITSENLLPHLWDGSGSTNEFSIPFYWGTWVLTWCLPPVVLARGVSKRDRLVMGAGGIAAILTLITNKPYLGWPRHTWDPMLLGALLIGVAIFIRRWIAKGPGEIRHGFTTKRLSGKDKSWMSAGATAFGLVSQHIVAPSPQPGNPDVRFGGGDSGGGGASSDF